MKEGSQELDPQLLVLKDAIEIRLAANGIFNTEWEGLMTNHKNAGPMVAISIHVGKPWPPLEVLRKVEGEILGLFKGGKVKLVLDSSVIGNEAN